MKIEELEGERSRLEEEKKVLEAQLERFTLQVSLGDRPSLCSGPMSAPPHLFPTHIPALTPVPHTCSGGLLGASSPPLLALWGLYTEDEDEGGGLLALACPAFPPIRSPIPSKLYPSTCTSDFTLPRPVWWRLLLTQACYSGFWIGC